MSDRELGSPLPEDQPKNELAAFVEHGLIPAEIAKTLSVAVKDFSALASVSTLAGARHFNTIDTFLSVRAATPTSQARECLSDLGKTWDNLRGNFFKYQELFLEARISKAKLNKKLRDVLGMTDPDDRLIAEAECLLEQARLKRMESEVAQGQMIMQRSITKATSAATQYGVILKGANKDAFTEEDFLAEEINYFLKSAFWTAAQVFTISLRPSEKWNKSTPPSPQKVMSVRADILLCLNGLGISENDVKDELNKILDEKNAFNHIHEDGYRPSFDPYLLIWLDRMANKFRPQVLGLIKKQGIERLRRLMATVPSMNDDKGKNTGDTPQERNSVFE